MKKVTVIIPYRNEVAYLKDCVQSVPRAVADVLIVPDCHGEPVPEEIAAWDHVTVMPVPEGSEQKGVAWCRNQGMKAAMTEYVYFLDCDDYVIGDSLEKLLSCAEDRNASLVTGNITKSWYSPINYEANEKMWESEIENICPLGDVVKERFATMFSANHLLLRKNVIEKKQISFSEKTVRYSDFSFVTALLRETMDEAFVVGEATYVSRLRNDMIHLPALSQQESAESGREFLTCYDDALKEAEGNDDLVELLHKHLVDYVVTRFPKIVTFSVVPEYRKRLAPIANAKAYVAKENVFRRMQLRFIRNGHYKLARRMTQANTLWTKKEGRFGSKIQWYRILEHFVFKKMPIKKNWILFESFFGKSYSDSPKYLYEYLQKNYGDRYRYIWILNGRSESLKKTGRHTTCKMNSLRYVYYTARCGYRIFNVRQAGWCKKRPGVVFLETWHGTPLKKLAFDLGDLYTTNQRLKAIFYEQGKEWDYLTSANPFSTETLSRAFGVEKEKILEYGYPRNDILYAENKDEIANEVKEEFGIPRDKRVILYAPTWRDNQMYRRGEYKFSLAMDLERMQKEFSRDSVILLRTHYYIADMLDFSEYEGFVFNGSQYEDVSRLYLASDICITDYSSVFFDYANLKRPLLFFAYDYDEYADEIRGLYIDMEKELPGPILKTNDELIDALHHMDEVTEAYKERYEEFYERFCCVDDGHACQRTVEKMFQIKGE